VGEWTEHYPNGKRKKVVAFGKDPFDRTFRPFVRREWDENGRETYSSGSLR